MSAERHQEMKDEMDTSSYSALVTKLGRAVLQPC
jgi:hypothetical protein